MEHLQKDWGISSDPLERNQQYDLRENSTELEFLRVHLAEDQKEGVSNGKILHNSPKAKSAIGQWEVNG